MSRFKLYFFIFSLYFQFCWSEISDKRLCLDEKCSQPISTAKTVLRYSAPDNYQLSFAPNEPVTIYSKSAGSNEALWGAEIRGKRGYIPWRLVKEMTILTTTKPTFLVDTELGAALKPQVPSSGEIVRPSKVKESHEVIDGTTIYPANDDPFEETEEATSTEDSQETLVELPELNSSNEIDQKNEQTTETSTESGGYLSGMFDTVIDLVDSTVNHINTLSENNGNELDKSESSKSDSNRASISSESSDSKEDGSIEPIEISSENSNVINDNVSVEKNMNAVDTETNEVEIIETNNENNTENSVEKTDITDSALIEASENKENISSQTLLNPEVSNSKPLQFSDINNNHENISITETTNSHEVPIELGEKIASPDILNKDSLKSDETSNLKELGKVMEPTASEEFNEKSDNSTSNAQEIPDNSSTPDNVIKYKPALNSNGVNENKDNESKKDEKNVAESKPTLSTNQGVVENKDNDTKKDEEVTESKPTMSPDEGMGENMGNETEMQKENVDELKPTVSAENKENNTRKEEVEVNSDNSKDLQKETVTQKPWSFVPTSIPVESAKIFPMIDENSNSETPNASEVQKENATESPNIQTSFATEMHKNPTEPPTESFDNDSDQKKSSEIVETIEDVKVDKESVNDTEKIETSYPDSTPTYSEYATPTYPPFKLGENMKNYEGMQKPEEYSDTGKENESWNNDNAHQDLRSGSDVFSTTIPDNNLNEQYKDTGNDNEKLQESAVESKDERSEEHMDSNMGLFSYLEKASEEIRKQRNEAEYPEKSHNALASEEHCNRNDGYSGYSIPMELNVSSDLFLYLATTALSVIIFLLGYFALDKSRREGPLVAKINKLEKEFLVILKEKEILAEQISNGIQQNDPVESQEFVKLQQEYEYVFKQKQALEEQVQTLEKELENSTEVGLELNRMLSELLNSENAGETLMSNIEQLQAQLAEQQEIVSNMKETLSLKETENHELNLELDIANKKVVELQGELDKLLLNIMKVEEEKELQEKTSDVEIGKLKENLDALNKSFEKHQKENSKVIDELKEKLSSTERDLQLKIKEYDGLKATMQKIKTIKNANTLESLLEVTSIKAELEQLKTESEEHSNNLRKEKEKNCGLEKKSKKYEDEIDVLTKKLDETDRARLELETKLQVLTTYFKDRETQLQKDLSKYESMWSAKQGEATSTSERIKYLQSEVQNYKSQNESLKEEIVSQEVELKSQISVLEKKVHENWVSARQAERRLEDLKQEAAQLRNRLTLRERALQEDKTNRMQSPLEQNGDGPPLHMDTPSSPPLLYNPRDHITKSPAMMGMPPPFLPPPPGAPFLPPPHMPFMPPPPPDMFPGDHRPPPLGRMSSPPLNSGYSPDRRPYSPYDRRSPSPSYDESDFVSSPVHHRRFSPFTGMDHRRMPPSMGKVNGRSGALSSGSGNSNESLDEINHSNSKV